MAISNVCSIRGAGRRGRNSLSKVHAAPGQLDAPTRQTYCVTDSPDAERSPRERVTRKPDPAEPSVALLRWSDTRNGRRAEQPADKVSLDDILSAGG